MSWLFSQALVAEYLPGSCSDGEQSAQSNGNPIQLAYCAPDKMMAFSRLSRFGMTYKPLTADRGKELLMSYLAAFHAKTSALQGKAQALTEPDQECGPTWRASLAKFDPDSYSWKTAQLSLLGDSELSSVIWPRSGMTVDGQCWELPTLERRISATDSGLWPTPTVCGNYNRKGASATSGDGLATAVQRWPTPTVNDSKNLGGGGQPNETPFTWTKHDGATLAYTEFWFNALGRDDAGMGWLKELGSQGDAGTRIWGAEPDVGRVANGVAARVDRLKAIGNGQVPLCAATAWRILTS